MPAWASTLCSFGASGSGGAGRASAASRDSSAPARPRLSKPPARTCAKTSAAPAAPEAGGSASAASRRVDAVVVALPPRGFAAYGPRGALAAVAGLGAAAPSSCGVTLRLLAIGDRRGAGAAPPTRASGARLPARTSGATRCLRSGAALRFAVGHGTGRTPGSLRPTARSARGGLGRGGLRAPMPCRAGCSTRPARRRRAVRRRARPADCRRRRLGLRFGGRVGAPARAGSAGFERARAVGGRSLLMRWCSVGRGVMRWIGGGGTSPRAPRPAARFAAPLGGVRAERGFRRGRRLKQRRLLGCMPRRAATRAMRRPSMAGNWSRLARPRSSRNWRVVANSAGRPGASRWPMASIQPRSSSCLMIWLPTVTPRMSSMSPRVTGWR